MYHMQIPAQLVRSMDIFDRKWHIERFVSQKQKENEAIESERKKTRR